MFLKPVLATVLSALPIEFAPTTQFADYQLDLAIFRRRAMASLKTVRSMSLRRRVSCVEVLEANAIEQSTAVATTPSAQKTNTTVQR